MFLRYYVFHEERNQLKEEAVRRAVFSIEGPVVFFEHWPGEDPQLTLSKDSLLVKREFCRMVWNDKVSEKKCAEDYEKRAANCKNNELSLCWLGVHNIVCPVQDEHGGRVVLMGGEFRIIERKKEAEEKLEDFLVQLPVEKRDAFRKAWEEIPDIHEKEALGPKMRELELAGRSYLHAIKQRSDFHYSTDLATHDFVRAIQALIADIEVLKLEMKDAFNIGKKWERRFEALIKTCEDHHAHLESRLESEKSKYKYKYESISKLIHECVDSYRVKAKKQGKDFQIDLEQLVDEEGEHKVLSVRVDRVALGRAIRNLIDNAVKYSTAGSEGNPNYIKIMGRLESMENTPGYAIAIVNRGIGIDVDELELIFEPGYQGRRRIGNSFPGYGIGLAYVKECMEKHGGTIKVWSAPQQGDEWLTSIVFWLPLHGPA